MTFDLKFYEFYIELNIYQVILILLFFFFLLFAFDSLSAQKKEPPKLAADVQQKMETEASDIVAEKVCRLNNIISINLR